MASLICLPDQIRAPHDGMRPVSARRLELAFYPGREARDVFEQWRALEMQIGDDSLMCSADWTQTWLTHYGDLVPHRFAVARADGKVCGVCLLTAGVAQKDGPFPVRSVHVGTAGEPDADNVCVEYNRLLIDEGLHAEFVHILTAHLAAEAAWDEIRLDGFARSDAEALFDQCRLFQVREAAAFYHDLAAARDSGSTVLEQLGYATRKNIRKNLKAYGKLQIEWAESVQHAEHIFDEMVRLHQARWTSAGEPGAYASRRFYAFHQALLRRLVPQQRAVMFRVRCGTETVGCVQMFIDRNRALSYQGGSAAYEGKLSPGLVVDYLCMEECLRRGLDAYDFLCGGSHHKQKLSTSSTSLVWARLRRPRAKFFVLAAARGLKRAAVRIGRGRR